MLLNQKATRFAFLFAVITGIGKLKVVKVFHIHNTSLYTSMRLHLSPGKMVSTVMLGRSSI